jgi:hypothetical protein
MFWPDFFPCESRSRCLNEWVHLRAVWMAYYQPKGPIGLVGGAQDPFNEPFQKLLNQRSSYRKRYYASIVVFFIGYPLAFVFLYLSNPTGFASPTAVGWNLTLVGLDLLYLVGVLGIAAFLTNNARKYKLPIEHLAFLEVYLAKKDVEDYAQHPEQTSKVTDARIRLRNALFLIPYGRKDSLISTSAMKGVSDFGDFARKRLIPYLNPPFETTRAIDSLGYMAQYLLNPAMDSLPFIMGQLNSSLPAETLPPRKPFGREGLKALRGLLTRMYARMSWVSDVFVAFLTGAAIYTIAVFGLGAPPYDGFLGASATFFAAFFGIRYELRRGSDAGA